MGKERADRMVLFDTGQSQGKFERDSRGERRVWSRRDWKKGKSVKLLKVEPVAFVASREV